MIRPDADLLRPDADLLRADADLLRSLTKMRCTVSPSAPQLQLGRLHVEISKHKLEDGDVLQPTAGHAHSETRCKILPVPLKTKFSLPLFQ